jgi:hypothetical protein
VPRRSSRSRRSSGPRSTTRRSSAILIDIDSPGGDARMVPEMASGDHGGARHEADRRGREHDGRVRCVLDRGCGHEIASLRAATSDRSASTRPHRICQRRAGEGGDQDDARVCRRVQGRAEPVRAALRRGAGRDAGRVDAIYATSSQAVAAGRGVDTEKVLTISGRAGCCSRPQAKSRPGWPTASRPSTRRSLAEEDRRVGCEACCEIHRAGAPERRGHHVH